MREQDAGRQSWVRGEGVFLGNEGKEKRMMIDVGTIKNKQLLNVNVVSLHMTNYRHQEQVSNY